MIERLILTTEDTIIRPNSLPSYIVNSETATYDGATQMEHFLIEEQDLKTVMERVEKWMIKRAYKECNSTYEMAKYLGISQPSVIRKLKKYKKSLPPKGE
ncbi:helix-turn-helix domain-containing protein [Neobacillus sp. OS1-32]|uniref:helix-turn-helix domain-containing protein n=1 Tax=Neobacillus sp. OS1-32 TaxID=3070682 RepID=UPI0027E0787B|nr:helix-turn-helix domain-containing protein [Neobacillus sp. OS1-32]WML28827.1 helix-turn-helix domain-containing protein [Neobacillus sp. OS1-32]